MSDPQSIFDATPDNFDALVLDNSVKGPVLVNYWAPGTGPWLKLWAELAPLARLLMRHGQFEHAGELLKALPEQAQRDGDIANLLAHPGFIRAAEDAPATDNVLTREYRKQLFSMIH